MIQVLYHAINGLDWIVHSDLSQLRAPPVTVVYPLSVACCVVCIILGNAHSTCCHCVHDEFWNQTFDLANIFDGSFPYLIAAVKLIYICLKCLTNEWNPFLNVLAVLKT